MDNIRWVRKQVVQIALQGINVLILQALRNVCPERTVWLLMQQVVRFALLGIIVQTNRPPHNNVQPDGGQLKVLLHVVIVKQVTRVHLAITLGRYALTM